MSSTTSAGLQLLEPKLVAGACQSIDSLKANLNGSDEGRLQMSSDCPFNQKDPTQTALIRHKAFNDAYQAIQECYDSYGQQADPLCKVFTGPSGSGKSTLIKTFRQEHPTVNGPHGDELTVLVVTVPSQATINSFAENCLRALKDPYPTRGTAATLGARMDKALGRGPGGHSVRVLLLEEAQRFVDSRWIVMWDLGNFLRERIESWGGSIVLSGLDYTDDVVDCNNQLQRLFGASICLKPFEWAVEEDRTEFRAFLNNLKTKLSSAYELPDIAMPDLAFRLHYASYGLIGYVMKIIRGAADIARARNTRFITKECLAKSYDIHIRRKNTGAWNPFTDRDFCPENAPPQLSPHEEAIAKRSAMTSRKRKAPRLSAKNSSGI